VFVAEEVGDLFIVAVEVVLKPKQYLIECRRGRLLSPGQTERGDKAK
jgi:hypothetical protein